MKTKYILLPLLVLAAGFVSSCSDSKDKLTAALPAVGQLVEPTAKDAAWLAKARADYPLKTCVVSGDELGGMGEALDRIYRQPGQPDRLVRFCCDDCPADFMKDPAKYLKQLDHPEAGAHPHDGMAMTYACPMHPDVTSNKPGDKCSKCGMALVAVPARHHH